MHNHDGHHHHPPLDLSRVSRLLVFGIILNMTFVVIEFGAGFLSGSLALMSDAGHNLSDVATLALALLAFQLFKVKPSLKFTYGYRRGSILISLLNAIILLVAVGSIGYEAVQRFVNPKPVEANVIIWVAAIGIVINFLSAILFFRNKEDDLNIKGAYLHLLVDALVSVGVVASGVIVYYTNWLWIDPMISLVIMVVIIISTWKLLQDSFTLSLDAVPKNIDIEKIRAAALKMTGIKEIHHIHVWALSTSDNALTAHLVVDHSISHEGISKIKSDLRHELEHLGVRHATLETEVQNCNNEACQKY
jgi:cobalt-zinc-cadmium efflux system protein